MGFYFPYLGGSVQKARAPNPNVYGGRNIYPHPSTQDAVCREAPPLPAHPVHDERLAHVQPLLQKLGGDGHGVEVAEAPARDMEKHGAGSVFAQLG